MKRFSFLQIASETFFFMLEGLNVNTGMDLPFHEYEVKSQICLPVVFYESIRVWDCLRGVTVCNPRFWLGHQISKVSKFFGKIEFTCNLHVNYM